MQPPVYSLYGEPTAAKSEPWIKQRFLAWSPFSITETTINERLLKQIYRGNPASVSAGFPSDGKITFFRTGGPDIGEANSNLLSQAKFDYMLDVAAISLQVVFPRSICDGADLKDLDGRLVTDPLAARKLASRYTRFFELYIHNSTLAFDIAGSEICKVPLEWVGSGPTTHVEGLSISGGPSLVGGPTTPGTTETPMARLHVPSVSAFSARVGNGKAELWNLGDGVRIDEQQTINIVTTTDANIVKIINEELLSEGSLYEDARVGIRIKAGLYGDRTRKAVYGAK